MQLLQLSLSLSLLCIIISFSQSTNVDDSLLGFIHEAKVIASIVCSDADILYNAASDFTSNTTKMRENQIKLIEHFNNISIKIEQIENSYVTLSKPKLYGFTGLSSEESYEMDQILEKFSNISDVFLRMKSMYGLENAKFQLMGEGAKLWFRDLKVANYLILYGDINKYLNKDFLSHFVNLQQLAIDRGYPQKHSPQQHIYSMYMDIALTELKAYILSEYTQLMLRAYGESNLIVGGKRMNYKATTEEGLNLLRNLTQQADRVLWRSDPEEHVFNVTYDEVTRLLQGYVANIVNLTNEGSCSQSCYDYQNTTLTGCFDRKFCSQQPQCSGRIHSCQFVDSDFSVCQSPKSSNRRYEYIQNNDGKRFGDREECWRDVNRVESWNRWLSLQCCYCFCLCDGPSLESDRFFNLRETLSDVQANKVVTGVRFVKKNRVFHLQIQQGQLLPRGAINESTLEWKPVDDYEIYDSTIMEGVDYHTLSYQSRAVDLDEVTKPDDATFVVTGVRFQVLDGHLNLKVRFSKFDFLKGEIVDPQVNSVWQAKDDIPNREKLNIDNLDVPTRSLNKSKVLSGDNQYLEFVNTDMNKDAAQTTIPFIDLQNAASNQPVPLAGIGLYYKGSYGYGGFVALKIITFDILPYLPLPETITNS